MVPDKWKGEASLLLVSVLFLWEFALFSKWIELRIVCVCWQRVLATPIWAKDASSIRICSSANKANSSRKAPHTKSAKFASPNSTNQVFCQSLLVAELVIFAGHYCQGCAYKKGQFMHRTHKHRTHTFTHHVHIRTHTHTRGLHIHARFTHTHTDTTHAHAHTHTCTHTLPHITRSQSFSCTPTFILLVLVGICAMCGVKILDVKMYRQSTVWVCWFCQRVACENVVFAWAFVTLWWSKWLFSKFDKKNMLIGQN